ncbi:MAG: ATP-binding protein [Clostridium sp.]
MIIEKEGLDNIDVIEENSDLTIAYVNAYENNDNINKELISQYEAKKIKLNKFWVTEETVEAIKSRSINKIYDQGKPKYSFLTKFIIIDGYIVSIGMSIPYLNETIGIVNKFNTYLMMCALILIGILVLVFSRRIINPIEKLIGLSKDIQSLNFRTEKIQTGDEIEDLANSINSMSISLENAHNELNLQNDSLKIMISDTSHELKTPVALIKVYARGIEDGLDDGTYIETILEQTENMENLIDRLLYWAKFQKNILNKSSFSLSYELLSILKKYELIIKENNIELLLEINEKKRYEVYGDRESIIIVLNNLISNAIKYTNNKKIKVKLLTQNNNVEFKIINGTDSVTIENTNNIWKPFYVVEESRSKDLSGTGLGLPIVKTILENHKFHYGVKLIDGDIEFYIVFNSY